MRTFWALTLLLPVACAGRLTPARTGVDVLVLAPHPDDEVLMAAGVIAQAVARGERVAVVVMTNGDLSCARDGARRQGETVAALGALGLNEDAVRFLGYPDGHLERLTSRPLPPVERLTPDGRCERAGTTTASRGLGRVDEHTRRTGAPAPFTAEALTQDLQAVLLELSPRDVYLPHGIDDHPDHAMTYVYFRRALDRLEWAPRRVHRAVVHAGRCWPSACDGEIDVSAPLPPLPAPLTGYRPDERVSIDGAAKRRVIALHASQLEGPVESDWLGSFARSEEAFFVESYVRTGRRWIRADAVPAAFVEEARYGEDGFLAQTVRPTGGAARDDAAGR